MFYERREDILAKITSRLSIINLGYQINNAVQHGKRSQPMPKDKEYPIRRMRVTLSLKVLPSWARPWDQNSLVILPEEKNPMVQKKAEVIDPNALAAFG